MQVVIPDQYLVNETWTKEQFESLLEYPTDITLTTGETLALNKANVLLMLERYKKQEISFHGGLKEFCWWWFVKTAKQHPELFQSNSYSNFVSKPEVVIPPKTQKGLGVQYLKKFTNLGLQTLKYILLQGTEKDSQQLDELYSFPAFARPCPKTPRHGFLESRKVDSKEEIQGILQTVLEVDPDGELLVMPVVDASLSAVVTPTTVVVGPGHDGATAGKNTKTFPLTGQWTSYLKTPLPGIESPDVPYVEVVCDSNSHYAVQMRGGPPTPRSQDYIPNDIRVVEVITAEGDLLEWESKMKEAKDRPGVIIDHKGGSLTSHYAVHAQLNNIPVVCSTKVKKGTLLTRTVDVVEPDLDLFTSGLVKSITTPYSKKSSVGRVTGMCYATQYHSMLGKNASYYLGYAVGTMLQYGLAACGGEWRYQSGSKWKGYPRNKIYSSITKNYVANRTKIKTFAEDFQYKTWGGGYGGKKWYACAAAIIELDKYVLTFLNSANNDTYVNVVQALNVAINQAHNNGWWFNKFVPESTFSNISNEKLASIIPAVLWLYELPIKKKIPTKVVESVLVPWSTSSPIECKEREKVPVKVSEAQIRIIQDNCAVTTPDAVYSTSVRIQYKVGKQVTEIDTEVSNLKDIWIYGKPYQKSWVSSLIGYLPMQVEVLGQFTELKFNGQTIKTLPVQYEYA